MEQVVISPAGSAANHKPKAIPEFCACGSDEFVWWLPDGQCYSSPTSRAFFNDGRDRRDCRCYGCNAPLLKAAQAEGGDTSTPVKSTTEPTTRKRTPPATVRRESE